MAITSSLASELHVLALYFLAAVGKNPAFGSAKWHRATFLSPPKLVDGFYDPMMNIKEMKVR
jgi:hypothetical protein